MLLIVCLFEQEGVLSVLLLRNFQTRNDTEVFLQPPPGKRYVRSFLFSRRIDAPFARIHLLARVFFVFCLSIMQLRTIDALHPDPAGASFLWVVSLLIFLGSGMYPRAAGIYLLLTFPALLSIFTSWLFFNPIPGRVIFVHWLLYSGKLFIGVALWELLWLAIVLAVFLWQRRLLVGIVLATITTVLLTHWLPLPSWTFASLPFFRPLTIQISDRGLLVAFTKVVGYSGMVLMTAALVVSSRDVELIGALRQLRVPQPVIFFMSTVFRTLDLTLIDYETIHQAQVARAINAHPRSFVKRVRDLGSIAVPMIAMMIRRSSEIGDALWARGYQLGYASTDFYETTRWQPLDWGVVIVSLCLLFPGLGPHVNLTTLLHWN